MAKPCPINHDHETREVSLGGTKSFDFCTVCKEDVVHLAKNRGLEWSGTAWQASAEAAEEEVDEFDENFEDEDVDAGNPPPAPNRWQNPPGFNPNPTRNMGAGSQQIVLLNDNETDAQLVLYVLNTVFNKDPLECSYVMNDAHYNGRSVCFFADPADATRLLQEVENKKNEWILQGCPARHAQNLRFVVEPRPANP